MTDFEAAVLTCLLETATMTEREQQREGFGDFISKQAQKLKEAARKELMAEIWHKGESHPGNRHPYPVVNPDTQEMAFAYYDLGWRFDRDYTPGRNMLWMDIEKILPKED